MPGMSLWDSDTEGRLQTPPDGPLTQTKPSLTPGLSNSMSLTLDDNLSPCPGARLNPESRPSPKLNPRLDPDSGPR